MHQETRLDPGPEPVEKQLEELPATPFWATIWQYVRPYRRQVLFAQFCALLVGVAVALQPITVKWIIDSGALREVNGELAAPAERWRWTLVFVGVYVFLSAFRITIWFFGYRGMLAAIEGMLCRLRGRFFRHIQGLCFRFHDQVSSGELFNYIMGSPVVSIRTFLNQFAMVVPYQAVSWVVAVIMLFSFNWVMTLITLAVVAIVVTVNYRSRFKVRELSADFMRTENEVSKYVADMLHGCRAIKIHAMEENVTYSFEQHIDRVREKGMTLSMRQKIESMKPEGINYAGLACIYVVGGWFLVYRDMKPGTFYAFVATFNMLMAPLMMMLQLNLVRANAEAGLDRIQRIMRVAKSTPELPAAQQTPAQPQARRAEADNVPCLVVEDVCFEYEPGRPVFDRLCCEVRHGQSVALVGPSGSGKSTFINLLLRLYDPQSGRLILNGKDLREYSLQDLRGCFGVVTQDPFIFQATIADNIRVTCPEATAAELREAMEIAQVSEFVDRMPKGVNTWIGEGGFNVSGGQRQRLAIARAVLAKPRYFVFDEATSALDTQSEKQVQAAMERLVRGHTSFIIAHRLSTIRNVDRILVFDRGQIVQDGSYEDLSQRPGLFRELVRSAHGAMIG